MLQENTLKIHTEQVIYFWFLMLTYSGSSEIHTGFEGQIMWHYEHKEMLHVYKHSLLSVICHSNQRDHYLSDLWQAVVTILTSCYMNPKSELKLGTKVSTSRLEQWLLMWLFMFKHSCTAFRKNSQMNQYDFTQWSSKSEWKILRVPAACFCWVWRMLLRVIIFYTTLKLYMWIQYY